MLICVKNIHLAEPAYPKGDSSGSARRSWELRTLISQSKGKGENVELKMLKDKVRSFS